MGRAARYVDRGAEVMCRAPASALSLKGGSSRMEIPTLRGPWLGCAIADLARESLTLDRTMAGGRNG